MQSVVNTAVEQHIKTKSETCAEVFEAYIGLLAPKLSTTISTSNTLLRAFYRCNQT